MKRIFGNTAGLKPHQIRSLENLYRRRTLPRDLISPQLAKDLCRLSTQMHRQIGLMIDRSGKIKHVIIGDHRAIVIPDISSYRMSAGRLCGLRCVHTHLDSSPLSKDDLSDLIFLRLDMMTAITATREGDPDLIHTGHILPGGSTAKPYQILPALPLQQNAIACLELIRALETEIALKKTATSAGKGRERALLVSVTTASRQIARYRLQELSELARSGGVAVVGTLLQQRREKNPRYLMGLGKLQELSILALQKAASLIIFDQELNPSQIRSITDRIDLKIIDRTQLILDIFAQQAHSREGKLQVELAQYKYLLPRLVTENTAMSRLTGGIGGRGPGETKLEITRRRTRERIHKLEHALKRVSRQRRNQKKRRHKRNLPVISIIGYTNAGKSTLLNSLTQSEVLTANRLFATLDPTNRRLRFPRDQEVIITDTVGFIRDLPRDLMTAFRATLEELEHADLLLHVVDISSPNFKEQIKAVEGILRDLKLEQIPCIKVLNKTDRIPHEQAQKSAERLNAITVCAKNRRSLTTLIKQMQKNVAARPT